MKLGLRRAGYALGSVGSSLRLLRFATALRVTRRSPGREELSWPKASFRPSLTGSPTDGPQATRGGGSNFHRPDRSRVKTTGQVDVLMTCKRASLSGAMYHGFEGAISTFGVYFPYLNLALKWSNEPGPPHNRPTCSPPRISRTAGAKLGFLLHPATLPRGAGSLLDSSRYRGEHLASADLEKRSWFVRLNRFQHAISPGYWPLFAVFATGTLR